MNKEFENRFFLLIRKNKISITVLNSIKGIILTKETFVKNHDLNSIYYFLADFLEKNIIEIEKNLKIFVKDIYLIFENDNFYLAESSIKKELNRADLGYNQIKDSLIDIRSQFDKYSPGFEIIHMVINKYLINGDVYKNLPEDFNNDNLVIQIDFICLKNQIINDLKNIFSRHQISINKILSYDYLRQLDKQNNENIIKIANENLNGFFSNEVLMAEKTPKNNGFFEKFFNYFN